MARRLLTGFGMTSLLLAATLALINPAVSPQAAEVVDPDAHPLRASVGISAGSTGTGLDHDGVSTVNTTGAYAGFDARMAYAASRYFEVDAQLHVDVAPGDSHAVYIPTLGARIAVPFAGRHDIGLRVGLGAAAMRYPEVSGAFSRGGVYTGMAGSLTLDYRYWISSTTAFSIGPEVLAAIMGARDDVYENTAHHVTTGVHVRMTFGL